MVAKKKAAVNKNVSGTIFNAQTKKEIQEQLAQVIKEDCGIIFIMRLDKKGEIIPEAVNIAANVKTRHAIIAAENLLRHLSSSDRAHALIHMMMHD